MTNEEYLKDLLPKLRKPIPHQWRVQSYSKNKPIATVMAYIDQRDLMDVLDAYCVYGWQKKYEAIAGNLFCSIGITMPDGTTMWRSDCGVESQSDAEKGRASDAAKRAGVNWGIGRFLYDMKIQYVDADAIKGDSDKVVGDKTYKKFPSVVDKQGKKIYDLTSHINNLNPNAPQAPVQVPEPSVDDKVANMVGRDNPQIPADITQAIADAKNRAEVTAIWNTNPDLQTVDKFVKAIQAKSKEFPKPQTA